MHRYNVPSSSSPPPRAATTVTRLSATTTNTVASARHGESHTCVATQPSSTWLPRSYQCTIFNGGEESDRAFAATGGCSLLFTSPHLPVWYDASMSSSSAAHSQQLSSTPTTASVITAAPTRDREHTAVRAQPQPNGVACAGVESAIRRKKLRTPKKFVVPAPTPMRQRHVDDDVAPSPWTPVPSLYTDTDEATAAEEVTCHLTVASHSTQNQISTVTDEVSVDVSNESAMLTRETAAENVVVAACDLLVQDTVSVTYMWTADTPVSHPSMDEEKALDDGLNIGTQCVYQNAATTATTTHSYVSSSVHQPLMVTVGTSMRSHDGVSVDAPNDVSRDDLTRSLATNYSATTNQEDAATQLPPRVYPSLMAVLRHTATTMGSLEDRRLKLRYFLVWRLNQRLRQQQAASSVRRQRNALATPNHRPTAVTEESPNSPPPPAPSAPTPPPPPRCASTESTPLTSPSNTLGPVYSINTPTSGRGHNPHASSIDSSKCLFTPSPIADSAEEDVGHVSARRSAAVVSIGRLDAVVSQLTFPSQHLIGDTMTLPASTPTAALPEGGRASPVAPEAAAAAAHYQVTFTKSIAGSSMLVTTTTSGGGVEGSCLPPRSPVPSHLGAIDAKDKTTELNEADATLSSSILQQLGVSTHDGTPSEADRPVRIKFFHGVL